MSTGILVSALHTVVDVVTFTAAKIVLLTNKQLNLVTRDGKAYCYML
jgi:hypothetical protein